MNSRKNQTMLRHVALAVGPAAAVLLGVELVVFGQSSGRGTISGRITADQGQVRAFRVAAHNLDRRIWYTVFTEKSQVHRSSSLAGSLRADRGRARIRIASAVSESGSGRDSETRSGSEEASCATGTHPGQGRRRPQARPGRSARRPCTSIRSKNCIRLARRESC